MKRDVAFQFVYCWDPFTESRVVVGAMVIEGYTIRYVARSEPPGNITGAIYHFIARTMKRLRDQQHPWDIGPQCVVGGRMNFVPTSVDDPDAWILRVLEDGMFRGGEKR